MVVVVGEWQTAAGWSEQHHLTLSLFLVSQHEGTPSLLFLPSNPSNDHVLYFSTASLDLRPQTTTLFPSSWCSTVALGLRFRANSPRARN